MFYKINTFLQKITTCIGLQTANIICKYITCIFFQFWMWLLRFVFYVVSKRSSFLWQKKNWIIFAALYFYLCELKSVSQTFEILFQTGDINIFVLCGVFFSIYVWLKSCFSNEKNISSKIGDTLFFSINMKLHIKQKIQ